MSAQRRAQIRTGQDAYRRDMASRLIDLRGALRETIDENDALGIKQRQNIDPADDLSGDNNIVTQSEFRQQVKEWLNDHVLERSTSDDVESGQHYTAVYVAGAYESGVRFADTHVSGDVDVSDVISRPVHQTELETLYDRNYDALSDITDDIDRSLTRILSTALQNGWGARKTANTITSEVEDIQHTRARALATSELMHAHTRATVKRYKEFDVNQVDIITHDPCEQCKRIAARAPYQLDRIPRNGPPFHPHCMCVIVPT